MERTIKIKRCSMGKIVLSLAVLLIFASGICWAGDSNYEVNKSNSTATGYAPNIKKPEQQEKKKSTNTTTQNKKYTYNCYWQAECFRGPAHAIDDGSYFGQHSSPSEAISECKRDAERQTSGFGGHCNIQCTCR